MAGEKHTDTQDSFNTYQPLRSKAFAVSLILEFVCVMLFQFLGGSVTKPEYAPMVNGLSLAVLVYISANISGGHLNPAVTISMFCSGNYPMVHSAIYVVLQCTGAIAGVALSAAMLPRRDIFIGDGGVGCFDRTTINKALSDAQIFGWECIMTFVLISTVYACGVTKPGHGSLTPLAVGLSLWACAGVGGNQTGAALNPARVIGPLAVYQCGLDVAWIYILAELFAALLSCTLFGVVSGYGPLFPFVSTAKHDLTSAEAMTLWITGSPPARLIQGKGTTKALAALKAQKAAEKAAAEAATGHDKSMV